MADASGIAPRAIQFLRDNELGPFPTPDQATGLYEENTLAELAMISGCMGAGYPLRLSAALVTAFLSDNPNHPAARWCYLDHLKSSITYKGESWFHRHVILRQERANDLCDLTAAHDQDRVLVVADREFVLTGTKGKPRLSMLVGQGVDPLGPFALGRMRHLKRGEEPVFTPLLEEVNFALSDSPERTAAEIAYQGAARGAVALSTVNMSLSIRKAFQRVYELRLAKGGPLWEGVA